MNKIIIFLLIFCFSSSLTFADEKRCDFPGKVYENNHWEYFAVDNNSFYDFFLEDIFFPVPDLQYVYLSKSWAANQICKKYGWYEGLKKLEFSDFSLEWKKYFILKYLIFLAIILFGVLFYKILKYFSEKNNFILFLFVFYKAILFLILFIILYLWFLYIWGNIIWNYFL